MTDLINVNLRSCIMYYESRWNRELRALSVARSLFVQWLPGNKQLSRIASDYANYRAVTLFQYCSWFVVLHDLLPTQTYKTITLFLRNRFQLFTGEKYEQCF